MRSGWECALYALKANNPLGDILPQGQEGVNVLMIHNVLGHRGYEGTEEGKKKK